jgi:hypothetical protein
VDRRERNATRSAVFDPALFVVVEGFKPSELGIVGSADLNAPGVGPGVIMSDPSVTATFSGPVEPEDKTVPDAPQRFIYPFKLSFADASAFGFAGPQWALSAVAQLNAAGSAVSGVSVIELLKNPDPIILHCDQVAGFAWYLSIDIRVVQLKANRRAFRDDRTDQRNAVVGRDDLHPKGDCQPQWQRHDRHECSKRLQRDPAGRGPIRAHAGAR